MIDHSGETDLNKDIKRIEYFLKEIIPSAQLKKDWNKRSIMNAVGWATYCENLSSNSSLRNRFRKILELLSSSESCYKIDDLRNAKYMLFRALLLNHYICSENVDLIQELVVSDLGEERGEKLIKEVKLQVESYVSLMNILKEPSQKPLLDSIKLRLILEAGLVQGSDKFHEQLSKIIMHEDSFKRLMLLICSSFSESNAKESKIFYHTEQWLVNSLVNSSDSCHSNLLLNVARLDKDLLINCCESYSLFYSALLIALKQEAANLTLDETIDDTSFKKSISGILEYKQIVSLCKNLYSSDKLKCLLTEALEHYCLSNNSPLWHTVLNEIFKLE